MSERFIVLNAILKVLSPYPTYLFLNLGITPDVVTYTSIFFVIVSSGFLLSGLSLAGVVALLLFLLFDSVDGDMARVVGPSRYGGTLDSLGADFFYGLIPLSLGYFLLQSQITLWVLTPALLFLCATLVSVVFIIARIINIKTLRVLAGNNVTLTEVKKTAFLDTKSERARFFSRASALYRHVLVRGNFFSEPGMTLWLSFFVLAGLYKALGAYLIVSLGYGVGLLVINFIKIYFVFRSLRGQVSMQSENSVDLLPYQKETGSLYGSLFSEYDQKRFEESVNLFFTRHKKWGIDTNWFKDKKCLDAGCGGGRFMVALSRCGAAEVRGIDISEKVTSLANSRFRALECFQAKAEIASVLEIPFPNNYFDYVVSSGVIHHTHAPYKAFKELVRVLKPGGKLFLSVYGKGGMKWLANDIFRHSVCKVLPFSVLERVFKMVGVPPNKRYNTLDNLYVTYCHRFTEKEIRGWLVKENFTDIRRVKFERYDYEKLISRVIHGEGWLQFYAQKKS